MTLVRLLIGMVQSRRGSLFQIVKQWRRGAYNVDSLGRCLVLREHGQVKIKAM